MNVNTVALTGNLTRDPEAFSVGCNLGLAVNERVKENDEWTDRASFFDVVVFGKQADACVQYLSKGSPVAVQGSLRQDRWQTDGGDNRSKVKVVARVVQFLGSREDGGRAASAESDLGIEQPPATAGQAATGGHAAGSLPETIENLKAHCICTPGQASSDCPIEGHGIPFARPRIPDRETRRRGLFVGDVLPPGEGIA